MGKTVFKTFDPKYSIHTGQLTSDMRHYAAAANQYRDKNLALHCYFGAKLAFFLLLPFSGFSTNQHHPQSGWVAVLLAQIFPSSAPLLCAKIDQTFFPHYAVCRSHLVFTGGALNVVSQFLISSETDHEYFALSHCCFGGVSQQLLIRNNLRCGEFSFNFIQLCYFLIDFSIFIHFFLYYNLSITIKVNLLILKFARNQIFKHCL